MSALKSTFGANLKQLRRSSGLSQAALSERINLSVDMVGRMERGQAAPSFETIALLAEALGTSPAALFGGGTDEARGERGQVLSEIQARLADANDQQLRLLSRIVAAILAKE